LQPEQNSENGELSREASENCFSYQIAQKSYLYDFIINGRFVMEEYTEIYLFNAIPNII